LKNRKNFYENFLKSSLKNPSQSIANPNTAGAQTLPKKNTVFEAMYIEPVKNKHKKRKKNVVMS